MEETLFSMASHDTPLAHGSRPSDLARFAGQKHFLNAGFEKMIRSDKWVGLIFWGPPGCGKTTLATIISGLTRRRFFPLSAVTSGVKEIREALDSSRKEVQVGRPAWILFIDEVHRLNKAQQDVLLPYLEEGSIRFIGATTENPSFELNSAIASRCLIYPFKSLTESDLVGVLRGAISPEKIDDETIQLIARSSNGDARRALNLLEHLNLSSDPSAKITKADFEKLSHAQSIYYDKKSEGHYDTISAFIKSIRGSDPDASVYYLARMLEGGEDPVFIARRLVILASEDVGNANPAALMLANAAFQAVQAVGMPEARIILSQATTYLACSEKSNRSYEAIESAIETVKETGNLSIPMNIRNAPTQLMKEWGYGKGYDYPHAHETGWTKAEYLPKEIENKRFYKPSGLGSEKKFQEFLKARGKGE